MGCGPFIISGMGFGFWRVFFRSRFVGARVWCMVLRFGCGGWWSTVSVCWFWSDK